MAGGRSITRGGGSSMGAINRSSEHNADNIVNEESDSRIVNVGGKIIIAADGDTFKLNPTRMVHSIREIIKTKYEDAWPSWKKVPVSVRDMWFEELKKQYYWHPNHDALIRRNFDTHGSNLLKNILLEVRKKLHQKPAWLISTVWDDFKTYWNSNDFKKKSEIGKINRYITTGVGSSLHTGGSIPTSEIRRRLEKEKDDKISSMELFRFTHQRKSNKEWVDNTASQTYENFNTKWQENESTQFRDRQSGHNNTSDTEDWVKEHRTKKGRVYGLGSEATKYKGSCSSGSIGQATQAMSPSTAPEEVNEAVQKALNEQRRELRAKMEGVLRAEMESVLKVVEKQNKKIKKMKKKLRDTSEKSKTSSHNSVVGKERPLTNDVSSSDYILLFRVKIL